MVTKSGALLDKPEGQVQCCHHWIIEPASGPISRGVCKICGAEKNFDNVLEETPIDKYDASAFTRLSKKVIDVSLVKDSVEATEVKILPTISLN